MGSPESHGLSINKTNFADWELELSADEEELYYFEEAKQIKEPIEFAIYIQYMNRLTGEAIVKSIEENTIVVKGITVLYGYRYVSSR
ncbi:transposase [Bacillus cereus group sp. N11]|uniref:transposase n=1 Tax=Bacillus cereus group sp. N11 TaxID=2794585 RepID=UPI0027DADC64|nr:transposase [Bacillus cereus group sp. N11]